MASFTITSASSTQQTLNSGSDIGFVGSTGALVTGSSTAIVISASGALVVNDGSIATNSLAINAAATFGLINSGLIAAENDAISLSIAGADSTTTTIQNTGEIISRNGQAIMCTEAGISIANHGYISGLTNTILIASTGSPTLATIVNSGTINVVETTSAAIDVGDGMRLTNSGTILGDVNGGTLADTVDNRFGQITGTIDLGEGNNRFRGGAGDEAVDTGSGNDTLTGRDGDDDLSSGDGDDRTTGGNGDDFLYGGGGSDSLFGGHDSDTLNGAAGDDAMVGGDGDDLLIGDDGSDTMVGGNGADYFRFFDVADSDVAQTADLIMDFERGADTIDLSPMFAGTFVFAGKGPLTGAGTASVAYSRSGGAITVVADTNADGIADFHLLVTGTSSLTADDFAL